MTTPAAPVEIDLAITSIRTADGLRVLLRRGVIAEHEQDASVIEVVVEQLWVSKPCRSTLVAGRMLRSALVECGPDLVHGTPLPEFRGFAPITDDRVTALTAAVTDRTATVGYVAGFRGHVDDLLGDEPVLRDSDLVADRGLLGATARRVLRDVMREYVRPAGRGVPTETSQPTGFEIDGESVRHEVLADLAEAGIQLAQRRRWDTIVAAPMEADRVGDWVVDVRRVDVVDAAVTDDPDDPSDVDPSDSRDRGPADVAVVFVEIIEGGPDVGLRAWVHRPDARVAGNAVFAPRTHPSLRRGADPVLDLDDLVNRMDVTAAFARALTDPADDGLRRTAVEVLGSEPTPADRPDPEETVAGFALIIGFDTVPVGHRNRQYSRCLYEYAPRHDVHGLLGRHPEIAVFVADVVSRAGRGPADRLRDALGDAVRGDEERIDAQVDVEHATDHDVLDIRVAPPPEVVRQIRAVHDPPTMPVMAPAGASRNGSGPVDEPGSSSAGAPDSGAGSGQGPAPRPVSTRSGPDPAPDGLPVPEPQDELGPHDRS